MKANSTLREEIDTALHPERNGLLIKRGIAEGASHEHIIKESLEKLIQRKQLEAETNKVIEFASNVRKIDGTHEDVLIAYKNVVDYVKHAKTELEALKEKV